MMSGQGVLTYKEGFNGTKAVYTGHFRANKRDGYGLWKLNELDIHADSDEARILLLEVPMM